MAYSVDGDAKNEIPASACKGRAGIFGQTFTGVFNEDTGQMRFNCVEDPSFWLEVNLSKMPRFAAAPGGALATAREVQTCDPSKHVPSDEAMQPAYNKESRGIILLSEKPSADQPVWDDDSEDDEVALGKKKRKPPRATAAQIKELRESCRKASAGAKLT